MTQGTIIDIGGGLRPIRGAWNLDPVHGHGPDGTPAPLWRRRIQDGIPLDDDTANAAYASHIFEHVPAGPERIAALNEVHRVLVPGAAFEMILPVVGWTDDDGIGHLIRGWQPYADPTHVSAWWLPESWLYVCDGNELKASADYGIRLWAPLARGDWELRSGWEARVVLHKPGDRDAARWTP